MHPLVQVLLLSVNICLQSLKSEEACQLKCEKNKKCVYHAKEGRIACVLKRCLKPKSHGFCRRYTQRYYFDHKTFERYCFKYGGCYGSRNNFRTKHACESRCFPPPLEELEGYNAARPDSNAPPSAESPMFITEPATSMAAEQLMVNEYLNMLTNTTATVTQLAESLTGITETFATTVQLGVSITIASASPTTVVQPTTTISPTAPITSMILTTPSSTTTLVISASRQQVPLNSPPGDNTLTIPAITITSPGFDYFSNYPIWEAQ